MLWPVVHTQNSRVSQSFCEVGRGLDEEYRTAKKQKRQEQSSQPNGNPWPHQTMVLVECVVRESPDPTEAERMPR